MDVRPRLSENSNSSQEQDVGKTDTSSNDEEDVITRTFGSSAKIEARKCVQSDRNRHATEEFNVHAEKDRFLKAGRKQHGFGQW